MEGHRSGCHPARVVPVRQLQPVIFRSTRKENRRIYAYAKRKNLRLLRLYRRGTAIFTLDGVVKTDDGIAVNLYNDCVYKTTVLDAKFALSIKADVYGKPVAKITVKAQSVKTALKLRIPDWMENLKITVDNEELPVTTENGYMTIDKVWTNESIVLSYKTPVKAVILNGKVAFTRGPVTLCRDERFGESADFGQD